jgi:hypothetical protein
MASSPNLFWSEIGSREQTEESRQEKADKRKQTAAAKKRTFLLQASSVCTADRRQHNQNADSRHLRKDSRQEDAENQDQA